MALLLDENRIENCTKTCKLYKTSDKTSRNAVD